MNSFNLLKANLRLLLSILILPTFVCQSNTYCVKDSSQLEMALVAAASSSSFNQIKITEGFYSAPDGGFIYDGANNNNDLWISGGWQTVNGNIDCGQQTNIEFSTILYGRGLERVLLIKGSPNTRVDVSNLSFSGGSAPSSKGGGLFIRDANLTLENSIFILNTAPLGGAALNVYKGYDHIIRNNVFSHNHSTDFAGAIEIYIEDSVLGVYFTNNTVVHNDTTSNSINVSSGLIINNINSTKAYIANNILLYNKNNDLGLYGNDSKYVVHNDLTFITGTIPINFYGNINSNPSFINGLDYIYDLNLDSPVIDKGILPNHEIPIFQNNWYPSTIDLVGNPRVQGGSIEMGAYETSPEAPIFANGFDSI